MLAIISTTGQVVHLDMVPHVGGVLAGVAALPALPLALPVLHHHGLDGI